MLAVGWLEQGHEFTTGPQDRELLGVLGAHWGWSPPQAPSGSHRCDLCVDRAVARTGWGGAIFIPGDGVLYVAPRLITHYMRRHGYAPPAVFRRAAMALPRGGSGEYVAACERSLVAAAEPPPPPTAYVDHQIEVLEGLEPVRVRPGMYWGDVGRRAIEGMLLEVVGNSLDEYLAGAATCVKVSVAADGWTTVEDDGRGIPIEPMPARPGQSALEVVFTTLHAGATFDGHHPHVHIRRHSAGLGLGPVSAMCLRLEVETRRAGVAYAAAFACGRVVEPLRRIGPTRLQGTVIRYLPDDDILDEGTQLDLEHLEARFVELARLCPRLDLQLQGRSLQRSEGLPGWVRELAPDAVRETALSAVGTVDDVEVEVALAWSPTGTAPRVRSFVNYVETTQAGSHAQGLLQAIEASARDQAVAKSVLAGLVGVVHVGLLHPRFKGPTRATLEVDAARTGVSEVVRRAIAAAPWWWDRLHERIK